MIGTRIVLHPGIVFSSHRLGKAGHQIEHQAAQPGGQKEGCLVALDLTVQFSLIIGPGFQDAAWGQDVQVEVVSANPRPERLD